MKPIVWSEISENELPKVAKEIAKATAAHQPFVVWLDGPMGAGKSTFVRYFLREQGLDRRIPVTSPTYTIMNEYEIQGKWYAHLDLYRAEANFSLEELGLDFKSFAGIFFEWYQAPGKEMAVKPTHRLVIEPLSETKRRLTFTEIAPAQY